MSTESKPSAKASAGCLVILAILLLGVAGGIWYVLKSLHEPKRTVATSIRDFEDLCGGRPIPGAAEYRPGAGAHPIAVFGNPDDDLGSRHPVTFDFKDRTLYPIDPASVQLVACTDRDDEGGQVATCPSREGPPVPVHQTTVEITVYEARTGNQVGEPITLSAQSHDCPMFVWYRKGTEPRLYATPTKQQYQEALAPFVR